MKVALPAIPEVPPSLNAVGSRGGHWPYIKAKRHWEDLLWPLLYTTLGVGHHLPTPVHASACLRFPTARRRDATNFSFLLDKALADAMQKRGYLADDTPEHYRWDGIVFDSQRGPAQTRVFLEVPLR